MGSFDEVYSRERDSSPKLPKFVIKDNVKWILLPTKVILSGVCLWPENKSIFINITNFVIVTSYLFFFYGSYYFATHVNGNLFLIVLVIPYVNADLELLMRYYVGIASQKRLRKLLYCIYYEFWSSNYAGDRVDQELYIFNWRLVIYISIYTVVAIICGLHFITNAVIYHHLPLHTTYPWNGSPFYEIFLVYQSFMTMLAPISVCAMDWFIVCLMSTVIAQFKLMKTYLKDNIEKVILKDGNCDEAFKILRFCITHHKKILWACAEINDIFKYLILGQFLTSIAAVCASTFVLTAIPEERLSSVTYLTGHMCEIFIYCYVGTELITESTSLSDAVFECGWHLAGTSNDFRRSLIMVMIRSQKPIQMSAGGFGYLSLPTFFSLVKFSFSIFTLLRHVTADKNISFAYDELSY